MVSVGQFFILIFAQQIHAHVICWRTCDYDDSGSSATITIRVVVGVTTYTAAFSGVWRNDYQCQTISSSGSAAAQITFSTTSSDGACFDDVSVDGTPQPQGMYCGNSYYSYCWLQTDYDASPCDNEMIIWYTPVANYISFTATLCSGTSTDDETNSPTLLKIGSIMWIVFNSFARGQCNSVSFRAPNTFPMTLTIQIWGTDGIGIASIAVASYSVTFTPKALDEFASTTATIIPFPTRAPTQAPTHAPSFIPSSRPTFLPTELCSPGRYLDGTRCRDCQAGTYQPGWGLTSCLICPIGTRSGLAATNCSVCPSGYWSSQSSSTCQSCALDPSNTPNWVSSLGRRETCTCDTTWSGDDCEVDKCADKLEHLSLGALFFTADPDLYAYSSNYNTDDRDAALLLLQYLIFTVVDLDGDTEVTKTEFLAALSDRSIYSRDLISADLHTWCFYSKNEWRCDIDSVSAEVVVDEALWNYENSLLHTFDGSGFPIVASLEATYPSTAWSDGNCTAQLDKNVSVNWVFDLSAGYNIRRVCGYTNGALNQEFLRNSDLSYGISTVFADQTVVDQDNLEKRVYCLAIEYCPASSGANCPDRNVISEFMSCAVGLRYVSFPLHFIFFITSSVKTNAPLDLAPTLTNDGVTFAYLDTSVEEKQVTHLTYVLL
jgi:hypothetical protein